MGKSSKFLGRDATRNAVEVQPEWIDLLKHMLGAGQTIPKKRHGYRNYFCTTIASTNHDIMLAMKDAGLVSQGRAINGMRYFHATESGCKVIGLGKSAIKRAFE